MGTAAREESEKSISSRVEGARTEAASVVLVGLEIELADELVVVEGVAGNVGDAIVLADLAASGRIATVLVADRRVEGPALQSSECQCTFVKTREERGLRALPCTGEPRRRPKTLRDP